ncbi:MAG: response regulator [Xenococcaceae cyanobacterium]
MQGNLNEIDIRSILQLLEIGQRTGELFVEAYHSHPCSMGRDALYKRQTPSSCQEGKSQQAEQFWFVFFVNGQIAYAADNTNSSLFRLQDYLHRYKAGGILNHLQSQSIATTNALEYAYIWLLLEKNILTPAQGRSIIQSMVQETLFDLFSLHQGAFIFEMGSALAPQLTTLEIAPLVTKIMKQVQQWKQFYPHIQLPNQCLVITDDAKLRAALPEESYQKLSRWGDGKTSLRQLSRYLNRDLLTVARAIYPYVQKGWVQVLGATPQKTPDLQQGWECTETAMKAPHVVCIDDDVTIGRMVEYILKLQGYESTAISDPIQALSLVFELKPDLILCDIAMPKLDGYEICAMLRRSTAFRQTPIIMLTGKEGFIDRVRARMVGSTDYLTKPFGESELLLLLEQYIGSGICPDLPKNE